MKFNEILDQTKNYLLKHSIENAEQEALWLLEELTQKTEMQLLLNQDLNLTKEQEVKLKLWLKQRVEEKKPLQYILGHVPFCDLDIIVEQPILIPRPETEEWVSWFIEKLKKLDKSEQNLKILDLCSGSGCIALALGKNLPDAQIFGIDINPKAIELANKNIVHNKIKNVKFIESDFYKNIQLEKFDIIVSNPPYINEQDWQNLSPTVKDWEDKSALVTNNNGFLAFEEIIKNAKNYLKENVLLKKYKIPQIILEIGKNQEHKVL
ncbi:peptide chain release factor N(5)-glutamine methyltransferase, partial [Candidatus Babeliales bacterium]|nr:peptide chain release factor N(5)-glutamine methyltransferase [Candidatus Babeliales bacterium]